MLKPKIMLKEQLSIIIYVKIKKESLDLLKYWLNIILNETR